MAAKGIHRTMSRLIARCCLVSMLVAAHPAWADALPSWNDGAAKSRIVEFVEAVIEEDGDRFVPPDDRVAVFDNDGTLWAEQPAYVQLAFAFDRVRALAPQHPDWASTEPFAAVLSGDAERIAHLTEHDAHAIIAATHAGMTTDEFASIVADWLRSAQNPILNRPYTELAYAPMVELLAYLREHEFTTYIVSGGGIDFMRAFTEAIYGIPPEQVIGSSGKVRYELKEGVPVLVKLAEISSVDNEEGKPINIDLHIGRRPLIAFGNSDGDAQMLEWTTAAEGARLGAIIHHDDAEREWAYDRRSPVGLLDKALDAAAAHGWLVVSMKEDWSVVFAEPGGEQQ
jgi:phosphoglycolate phosphatase-like HAD superfamily hydrolase